MRFSAGYIVLLILSGCLPAKENRMQHNNITAILPDQIFSNLYQKKHSPKDFPTNFNFSGGAGRKEVEALGLDTAQRDPNTYYFLTDQKFFTQEIKGLKAILYFRYSYGEQTEKILRLQTESEIKEICLAMAGGDGMDYYHQESEFINDSIYRVTSVVKENIRDDQDFVAFQTDSIISEFRYDAYLNLQLQKRDTLRYTEELFYDKDHNLLKTSRSQKSRQFNIDKVGYFWNFITTIHQPPGEKNTAIPCIGDFKMQLIRTSDGEVVLADSDFTSADKIDVTDLRTDGFADLNFDGYKDFYNYSYHESGSGGSFSNAYIFNGKTKKFDFSKELSGGELTIDSVNKTLSTYWKSGIGRNHRKTIHFGTNGKIEFTENFTREVIPSDSGDLLKTTYLKMSGNKVVKKTVETSAMEEY